MFRLLLVIGCFCFVPVLLLSQEQCAQFERLIGEVDAEMADEQPDARFLFNKLRSARILSRNCSLVAQETVSDRFEQVFNLVDNQRLAAIQAEARAEQTSEKLRREKERSQLLAEEAQAARARAEANAQQLEANAKQLEKVIVELESARSRSDSLRSVAENALQRSRTLFDQIYFYGGRFGLVTRRINDSIRYGFIDKELNTVIPFVYDRAIAFNDDGFAFAQKGDSMFILDTIGGSYFNAYSYDEIANAEALVVDESTTVWKKNPGLQYPKVRYLSLLDKSVKNLSFLQKYPNLLYLSAIMDFRLKDLKDIATLKQLRFLDLGGLKALKSLKGIEQLTELRDLNLSILELTDITPLAALEKLERLNLRSNPIEDYSPLRGLEHLRVLNITGLYVSDLPEASNFRGLQQLRTLYVTDYIPESGKLDAFIAELRELLPGCTVVKVPPL